MATAAAGHTPATNNDLAALDQLLRGEISAIETYDQALPKFTDAAHRTVSNALTRIRAEHQKSADTLKSRIVAHGGKPSEGAGVWGVFANAVAAGAKLIGPQTVLAALKQGELHGAEDYEKQLKKDDLGTESRFLFRNELLPRVKEHLAALDGIIAQVDADAAKK